MARDVAIAKEKLLAKEVLRALVQYVYGGARAQLRSVLSGRACLRLKTHGPLFLALAIIALLTYLLPGPAPRRQGLGLEVIALTASVDDGRVYSLTDVTGLPPAGPLYALNVDPVRGVLPLGSQPGGGPQRQSPIPLEADLPQAVPFFIHDGGMAINSLSDQRSVGAALRDAGVWLGPADKVSPSPQSPLTAGMHVFIKRAHRVTLTADGDVRVVYTYESSVRDVIAAAGLKLSPQDEVSPSLTAAVRDGLRVVIARVDNDLVTVEQAIAPDTVHIYDDGLPEGQTQVLPGRPGVLHQEFLITYKDGLEVGRRLVRQWVDPPPRPQTVVHGTGPPIVIIGDDGKPLECVRTLRVYATWYNAASSGKPYGSPGYGITASGLPLRKGIVAVDPSVIPLGTRLYVPGYGMALAADTGGGIRGYMIDLAYPDDAVVDWRTGWVDVCILGP